MKLILLGMAMMGTATYGSTDLFHKAQDVTDNVTAVYATAAQIDHFADAQTRAKQQQKLYSMARDLEPFANEFGNASEETLAMLGR